MSDQYGIGTVMQMANKLYSQTARCTGRTSMMIDNLKNGDTVVFREQKEANRVDSLCRERGLRVKCVVSSSSHIPANLPNIAGRVVFDHGWVEDYYARVLADADARFVEWQAHLNRTNSKPPAAEFKTWSGDT